MPELMSGKKDININPSLDFVGPKLIETRNDSIQEQQNVSISTFITKNMFIVFH